MTPFPEPCRVDILTKDGGVLSGEATGLAMPIQATRAVATVGGDSSSHVIVRAAAPPWELPADGFIRRLFPADTVSCVRAEVIGKTTLSSSASDTKTLFAASAVAATIMRSLRWGESDAILVQFVSGRLWTILHREPDIRPGELEGHRHPHRLCERLNAPLCSQHFDLSILHESLCSRDSVVRCVRNGQAVNFEWDTDKAKRNLRKHGVSFDEAATAFGDPLSVTVDDPDHSFGEERLLLLGQTVTGKLIVVAHLDDGETIRLISARLAERHERRQYEEG